MADISGSPEIQSHYESWPTKQYVKLIPLVKAPLFEEYSRKEHFVHLADVVPDTETFTTGKKEGTKKRNTVIQLANYDDSLLSQNDEWIYAIVINDRMTKIGGTRNGIKGRWGSYMCGHHIPQRGKSGKASETNKYVYNTLDFYLQLGCEVKLYGYKLPVEEITRSVFGKDIVIRVQTYHSYESVLIDEFKRQHSFVPFLCDNSDPNYREA